jgi:hypothetical protein
MLLVTDPFGPGLDEQQRISTRDINWVAGFLEGEGSFGYHSATLRITAGQKQREPLDRCMRLMGGTIQRIERPERDTHIHHWALMGRKAVQWMMTLYVLMSPRRQAQIKECFTEWKQHAARRPNGHAKRKGDGAWHSL